MNTNSKKYIVFTDSDLDGAGSFLTLSLLMEQKLPYQVTTTNQFREQFSEWLKHNNLNDYDRVFILDLDVSGSSDLVDRPNVVIVDHHATHIANKANYKQANVIVEECTSSCKLIYDKFKTLNPNLTDKQKYLILLVDDYDSYQFKLSETHQLNVLFWNYQGDRVQKFYERFQNGFAWFDLNEQNIYSFYQKKLEKIRNNLDIFTAEVPKDGKTYKFVAAFATEFLNDVAEYILDYAKADVALVINPKTQKVSYRRSKTSDYNVSVLAQKLSNGGGHEFSAGGELTEKVMLFSKLFKPIKIA